MRNIHVVNAWANGVPARAANLWTDGMTIYSYAEPIGQKREDGNIYLTRQRFSVTTSRHQDMVRRAAEAMTRLGDNVIMLEPDRLPRARPVAV